MMSNHATETVIIGASTAGLFTAYLLAKGGVPVYLFEAQERLGLPARTLIVTHHLSQVLGCIPREAIVNCTTELQLFSAGRSASIRLSQPDLIIERERLIQMLAKQARAAGAEILPGYRLVSLEPERRGLVLRLERSRGRIEHVRTRVLIGADGVFSQVAEQAQWGNPARRKGDPGRHTAFILQAHVVLPPGARPDATQVWFDPQSTRYFYWLIPESQSQAVVGLVDDDQRQAQDNLGRFLSVQNLEPLSYQGAWVPLYHTNSIPWKSAAGAQVFLVGDAAAQVKATTVGGVVTGLRGAQAVARAILQGNDYRWELETLHRELALHLLVRKVLNCFTPSDYDELLNMVNQGVKSLLGTHTRDEIAQVLFRFSLLQPRLLFLAANSLLRSDGLLR